jgi:Carbon-nitrogen hydrolase
VGVRKIRVDHDHRHGDSWVGRQEARYSGGEPQPPDRRQGADAERTGDGAANVPPHALDQVHGLAGGFGEAQSVTRYRDGATAAGEQRDAQSALQRRIRAGQDVLVIGVAQIAPVWFKRTRTLEKACAAAELAAAQGCRLVVFGEALAPGYPFWIAANGRRPFDDPKQKAIFAEYLDQGVVIERGES